MNVFTLSSCPPPKSVRSWSVCRFAGLLSLLLSLTSVSLSLAQAPTVSMNFPEYNSSYIAGSVLNIVSTATIPAGATNAKVEFFTATAFSATFTKIGEATAAPYSMQYTLPTVGATGGSRQFRAVVSATINSVPTSVTQSNGDTDKRVSVTVYPPTYSVAPRNIYVSPSGTNASPYNSLATAATTIQRASDIVAPGDIVLVAAGTYTSSNSDIVAIRRTGLPTKPIVFMPHSTDKPKLQMGTNNWQAFNVLPGSAYVQVRGFEVVGNNANITLADARAQIGACEGSNPTGTPLPRFNGNGMAANGAIGPNNAGPNRPHHITFANNLVHDCAGGGIGSAQSDYVTIEDNEVYNTSWYTVYGTSGLGCISTWNYDAHTGGPAMIFRRNKVYNNKLLVAWNIGGTGTNCRFYDGNGIILDNNDAEKNIIGAYTGSFLIENNLSYLNGGRGININFSDNAYVINNTTYQNGATNQTTFNSIVYAGIESEIIAQGSTNLSVYNNIFYGRAGEKNIDISNSTSNVQHNNNLTFEGTGTIFFTGNQNITGQDPKFADAANANFQLQNTSPALQVGNSGQFAAIDFRGTSRPQGAGIDIGAYEMTAQELPVTLSQFEVKPLGNQVSVAWSTAMERNSNYFEVQRSANAIEFGAVGRVASAGDSQTIRHYGLLDETPLAGTSYYRLKQVDRDGTTDYSKIVSVVLDGVQPSVELLGNPVEAGSIRVVTRNLNNAVFQLTTVAGQSLGLTTQAQPAGQFVLLPVRPLPAGVYLLHARTDSRQLTRKIVVR